jgi:hypothetical protein
MNSNKKIMPWIDVLPGVEETNFQQLRDVLRQIWQRLADSRPEGKALERSGAVA